MNVFILKFIFTSSNIQRKGDRFVYPLTLLSAKLIPSPIRFTCTHQRVPVLFDFDENVASSHFVDVNIGLGSLIACDVFGSLPQQIFILRAGLSLQPWFLGPYAVLYQEQDG